ncbi:cytochrome P450 6k1-like [Oratosquilla oratoria]|uniref:cytochrome P450 6k1-like n=1 Tax=Oratosquilla oratoria TaxID=337810 RepID=UPI003F765505
MLIAPALLVTLLVLLLVYCHNRQQYWQNRGVFVPQSIPILGHILILFSVTRSRFEFLHEIFEKTKAPFVGLYEGLRPVLVVRDLRCLKSIMVKDFNHFVDRRPFRLSDADADVREMLGFLNGEQWKELRAILSPVFTSSKLHELFPLLNAKSKKLVDWCLRQEGRKVEMKAMFSRFTLDDIASCAFGLDSNSLDNEDDEFAKAAVKFTQPGFVSLLKLIAMAVTPWLCKRLNVSLFHPAKQSLVNVTLQSLKDRKTCEHRGDFLDIMLEAKQKNEQLIGDCRYPVTHNTIIAQSLLFIFAGFETTATTLSFTTYLLAKHPKVQEKLREELHDLLEIHGGLTFEAVEKAEYLEACVQESLRICPAATYGERLCTKDYTLPGTDITVKKGMMIGIPIWTINRDPNIWEDPESFRPERFLSENMTPEKAFALQTFGQGPRKCIGMRFALFEIKLVVAHLVLNLKLLPAPGCEGPLAFEKRAVAILTAKGGIHLKMEPLPASSITS